MTDDQVEPEARKSAGGQDSTVSDVVCESDPEPTFVSYAQHGEDVVLWRALRHVSPGNYVDVGAAHPVIDSVTKALYERGWRGIDIEPVEAYAQLLREDRPDDVVVQCLVGADDGAAQFFRVDSTGLSTTDPRFAALATNRGFEAVAQVLPVRTLDHILADVWDTNRDLHVLKIDVEGGEADVLAGTDLARLRPWVIVVEATEPQSTTSTRDTFDSYITDAGYRPTLFDGLNVFYVSPDHPELEHALSYAAGPLDNFTPIALRNAMEAARGEQARSAQYGARASAAELNAAQWQHRWAQASAETVETAAQARQQARKLRAELRLMKRNKETADEALRRLQRTPLRRLKGAGRGALAKVRPSRNSAEADTAVATKTPVEPGGLPQTQVSAPLRALADPVEVCSARLRSVLGVHDVQVGPEVALAELLRAAADLLEHSRDPGSVVWILHVALVSRFPSMEELAHFTARLALDGATSVIDELRRTGLSDTQRWASTAPMRIVTGPVIDASHTAFHNLHTGIQRVVREVVPRWLAEHDEATLVVFDDRVPVYRRPTPLQEHRVVAWDGPQVGLPEEPDFEIIVPWQTTIVVPELAADQWRTRRLVALASTSSCDVSFILFDLIPFTLPSACSDGMRQAFGEFMTVVREGTRVSTISEAVAADMTGFCVAYQNQAITAPQIVAQPLPIEAHLASPEVVDRLSSSVLGVPGLPLVVSVSSIEPRKNQLSILLAAERLWNEGHQFQLLFIAGSGWERENFDNVLAELQARGRPVRVVSKASEEFLWAAYQLARFSVFVSITEGFGLPAAESIAAGTPVVLSSHGSMREIGEGGGAEFVNAHDVGDITDGMRRLLTDDHRLAELRQQALARQLPTWDDYATDTWNWLFEGKQPS